jgi:hypothetical protein
MPKARSTAITTSPSVRKGRDAKSAAAPAADPCELFLAELRARRERLQHLLSMIHLEAGRINAARVKVTKRPQCSNTRRKAVA